MKYFLFLIFSSATIFAQGRNEKYWIYFKDKSIEQTEPNISPRAIERRKKVSEIIFTHEDYQISKSNLEILKNLNIEVINKSNWLNAVSVKLNETQKNILSNQKEILKIEKVKIFIRRDESKTVAPINNFKLNKTKIDLLNYGASYAQLKQIKVVDTHNLRINGRGVLVGMLDSGFRWRVHEATKKLKVIAEYDFIQKDSVTSNQLGDSPDQDHHGTTTFSTLGGFFEGRLIGPAYNAEFILGKTEYVPTETNIEEDNWVAGIEWMEKMGVDVVSSSLGYSLFDAGQQSYTYQDMNGRTAVTSKAATIAARKGVVVCTAMGNEGNNSWKYLVTPADADSIISVGAANSSGLKTGFSSVGPTSDKRIKPDVVALGTGTYAADASYSYPGEPNIYGYFQGTSLSTPLIGGAAAVLLSAFPELTPVQVRNILRSSASKSTEPDTLIGWGLIDMMKALHLAGIVISSDPEINYTNDSNYQIGFFISSSSTIKKDSVFLNYRKTVNQNFTQIKMLMGTVIDPNLNSGKYIAVIPREANDATIEFYISAKDLSPSERKAPYNAPTKLFSFQSKLTNIVNPILPKDFMLYQNYPNPFNPSTTIKYDLPKDGKVKIVVYNLLGEKIKTVVDEFQFAGSKAVNFSSDDLSGLHSSGIYFYRIAIHSDKIETESFTQTKKMMLLR